MMSMVNKIENDEEFTDEVIVKGEIKPSDNKIQTPGGNDRKC